jgi:hypothetical protein
MNFDCCHTQEVEQPTRKRVLCMTVLPHVHNDETSRALEDMDMGLLLSN